MYAVIETGGKQYRVSEGDVIDVERIANDNGNIVFDQVLACGDGTDVTVGSPTVDGASVTGELVEDLRGPKIFVFKMKRRQGYKRRLGHRQSLTRVKITGINAG
jgi:large subunit ribosomal protein L21